MTATRPPREHFVPLQTSQLVDLLCQRPELNSADRTAFRDLSRLIAATFHFEFHRQLQDLKSNYSSFDPDADTLAIHQPDAAERATQLQQLFERFSWLLERANYRRLTAEEIQLALSERSAWGLNLLVDFDLFDRLELYARGDSTGTRSRRRLRNLFRLEAVPLEVYQRLVVILRLRDKGAVSEHLDTENVYIKIFKDIPKMDLEMLLPGTRVKMSIVDRAKIVMPTVSGLAITTWKIIKGAMLAAAAGASGLFMLAGLLAGTFGYGARSFFGYLRTKEKYQLNLTRSLYFQNLDNNAGVLFRLLDEAEEQENREALLAYYFLWKHAPAAGLTGEELDSAIETYLRQVTGRDIDFEVGDALDKLVRLRIVENLPNGKLRAVPIQHSLAALDQAWDNFFQYHRAA